MKIYKRVLICGREALSTRAMYHALVASGFQVRVVVEQSVSRRQMVAKRLKKLGPATVANQLAFQVVATPFLVRESAARRRDIIEQHRLSDAPMAEGDVVHVESVNEETTQVALEAYQPDVVVLSGTRIVSQQRLSAMAVPVLNLHAGWTPAYRGVHGGYWALAMRDPQRLAVTLHRVDAGIDTGDVIARVRVQATPQDSFATYPLLQLAAGIRVLTQCLRGEPLGEQPVGAQGKSNDSRLWSHPTLTGYLYRRWLFGVR
jgi:methionyl-tRNA formyltransferase